MGRAGESDAGRVLADLLGLTTIGLLLVVLHVALPPSVQAEYVFRRSFTRPETFLTAAYLHLDDAHLIANLVAYAVVSLTTYDLCLRAGERHWFRGTTVTLLFLVPILVHLSSMVLWGAVSQVSVSASRGFSGVVAAFGGFLSISLLVSLRQVHSRATVRSVGFFLLFVVLGEILYIYAESPPVLGGAAVAIGVALVGLQLLYRAAPDLRGRDRAAWRQLGSDLGTLALVVAILTGLVLGLFPVELVADGTITNVFAHASGFVWGVVVSRWGYRYWGRQPR